MNETAMAISEQRLQVIAVEIQTIQQTTRATILSAACEIGRRLTEVKLGLPYGKWTDWLHENVDCSEKQAQNMMRLFEEYGKNPNPQTYSGLSVSQAIALLSAPEDVRADLIESGTAENMSVRQLNEEIKRQKEELNARQQTIDGLIEEAEKHDAELKIEKVKTEAAQKARTDAEEALKKNTEKFDNEARAADTKMHEQESEIGRLRAELDAARNAPAEIVQVEVTPAEVEAELAQLRETARKAPDKTVILARDAYERAMNDFKTCQMMLAEMSNENRAKYARAFAQALRRMADQMEG